MLTDKHCMVEIVHEDNVEVVLPPAVELWAGQEFIIIKRGKSGTVDVESPDPIDGEYATVCLCSAYNKIHLISNGIDAYYTI